MRLQDLAYDTCIAILTMLGLSFITGPIFYFIYNGIVVTHYANFLPLNIADAIGLVFGFNLCGFFRLQKRDILIAEPQFIEDEEENS